MSAEKGQKYKKKVKEIEKELKYYQNHPEQHCHYMPEWNKFYKMRFLSLKKSGIDPTNYDLTDEWRLHWTRYVTEFYEIKSENLRKEIEEKISELRSSAQKISKRESEEENISDSPRKRRKFSYSYSPISSEDDNDYYLNAQNFSSVNQNQLNLVSVCRIISPLEIELGSLSNNVINLLAKSLELEKVQPGSSEILMTNDTTIFLEIVKEKLKALTETHLLARNKISVAKKCIEQIQQLIKQSSQQKQWLAAKKLDDKKIKLAAMIAKELEAHGKSDFTDDELEAIIEIYLENLDSENYSLYNITDDDLMLLIKNFSNLDDEEQQHLLNFIKNIENNDPKRAERLHNNMNINEKPTTDLNSNILIVVDDDDDDYKIDDLVTQISHMKR